MGTRKNPQKTGLSGETSDHLVQKHRLTSPAFAVFRRIFPEKPPRSRDNIDRRPTIDLAPAFRSPGGTFPGRAESPKTAGGRISESVQCGWKGTSVSEKNTQSGSGAR